MQTRIFEDLTNALLVSSLVRARQPLIFRLYLISWKTPRRFLGAAASITPPDMEAVIWLTQFEALPFAHFTFAPRAFKTVRLAELLREIFYDQLLKSLHNI